MSKPLTKKDLPKFDAINKYNVAIRSLRNKLKSAKGIDELTNLATQIIELENQILTEKTNGYKQLEEEKKTIETRIDKLTRELARANHDLHRIGNSLDFKLNGYKKKLQTRIESLNDEYTTMIGYITNTDGMLTLPANISTSVTSAGSPSLSTRSLSDSSPVMSLPHL